MAGRRFLGASVVVMLTFAVETAFAQSDPAAAELYEKGLGEMEAGRYESACPGLAESLRLDRRPGALFTLAECEAQWGKHASAHAHYTDFLSWVARMTPREQTQQAERRKIANSQRDKLAPLIPKLTLILPSGTPRTVIVELDGVALNAPALSIPLPVDPGAHRIVVRTADGQSREQSVELASGESKQVDLIVPNTEKPPGPAPAQTKTTTSLPASGVPSRPSERSTGVDHSPWTYIAFGVGALGIVVGGVTGGLAWEKKSTVNDHCDGNQCDREGKLAADRGKDLAGISTVGFALGLVGVGIGSYLWISESNAAARGSLRVRPTASVTLRGAHAGAVGSF